MMYAMVGALVVLVGGTVAFHAVTDEAGVEAFYRLVVTTSLTGLDTVPATDCGPDSSHRSRLRRTDYLCLHRDDPRRGNRSWSLHRAHWPSEGGDGQSKSSLDHYIICGYGRVGRRVAQEFRESGAKYVVLDFNPDAIEYARERG